MGEMLSVIIKIVVGGLLSVLALYLTALVLGERQILRKTSTEHNTLLGKSIRLSLFLLVLLIAVVIALSCYASLWFLLILIPSVLLGFTLLSKSAAKKSLDSKSEREYEAARARLINKKSYTCMECGKKTLSADKVVKLQGKSYCRNCALNVNAQIDEQQWIENGKVKPPKQGTVNNERHKKEELNQPTFYKKGDFIGAEFEVYDVLGMGGFGLVYLVYHHRLKDVCAMKTLRGEYLEDANTRQRFKKEAKIWIDLGRHPYLIQAYLVEEIVDRHLIAMQYIAPDEQGLNTLDGYLKRQPPDLAQSLRWAIQFCHGMEYAYSKGIKVHRDIKPANIMITRDKILKISDFGLAGVIGEAKAISGIKLGIQQNKVGFSCQTMEGVGFGTPTHMPPEQFINAAGCDERSDIYSFGIVLYQMAFGGKLPFIAPLPQNDAYEESRRFWIEMYKLHRQASVPKFSSPLFSIIQKCLEKEPIKRYQSFRALRSELEPILKGQTGEAIVLPKTTEMEEWEWCNRGYSLVNLAKYQEASDCFDNALRKNAMGAATWFAKGFALQKLKNYQEALACYSRALEINSNHANFWFAKGLLLLYCIGNPFESIPCFEQALKINPRDAESWLWKGHAFRKLDKWQNAVSCYDKALEINPRYASAWYDKALVEDKLYRGQDVAFSYKRFIELSTTKDAEQVEYARKRLRELGER